jgi:hypothetical protein
MTVATTKSQGEAALRPTKKLPINPQLLIGTQGGTAVRGPGTTEAAGEATPATAAVAATIGEAIQETAEGTAIAVTTDAIAAVHPLTHPALLPPRPVAPLAPLLAKGAGDSRPRRSVVHPP